jgi:hypothetical protein
MLLGEPVCWFWDYQESCKSSTMTANTTTQVLPWPVSTLPFMPFLAAGQYKIIIARGNDEPSLYVGIAKSKVFQVLSTGQYQAQECV